MRKKFKLERNIASKQPLVGLLLCNSLPWTERSTKCHLISASFAHAQPPINKKSVNTGLFVLPYSINRNTLHFLTICSMRNEQNACSWACMSQWQAVACRATLLCLCGIVKHLRNWTYRGPNCGSCSNPQVVKGPQQEISNHFSDTKATGISCLSVGDGLEETQTWQLIRSCRDIKPLHVPFFHSLIRFFAASAYYSSSDGVIYTAWIWVGFLHTD